MEFNECETCGANGGLCGVTIKPKDGPRECKNCYMTRSTGEVYIDATLVRTEEELKRTLAILDK